MKEAKTAEAVRAALEPKGVRVINDKGKTVCEVWFSKEIPAIKNEVQGASFGQIPEGAFIGGINFPANTSDYRGQGIKAGFYTLRFALILQDGNHLGVSPARDFFLLGRAGEDKDPNTQLKTEDLLKLSRNARSFLRDLLGDKAPNHHCAAATRLLALSTHNAGIFPAPGKFFAHARTPNSLLDSLR